MYVTYFRIILYIFYHKDKLLRESKNLMRHLTAITRTTITTTFKNKNLKKYAICNHHKSRSHLNDRK